MDRPRIAILDDEATPAPYCMAGFILGNTLSEHGYVSRGACTVSEAGALEGITQHSVTTIAKDLGIDVELSNIVRSDVYIAEEMFLCGTAAEVSAVNSLDDRPIPCPGPMTTAIAEGPATIGTASGTSKGSPGRSSSSRRASRTSSRSSMSQASAFKGVKQGKCVFLEWISLRFVPRPWIDKARGVPGGGPPGSGSPLFP